MCTSLQLHVYSQLPPCPSLLLLPPLLDLLLPPPRGQRRRDGDSLVAWSVQATPFLMHIDIDIDIGIGIELRFGRVGQLRQLLPPSSSGQTLQRYVLVVVVLGIPFGRMLHAFRQRLQSGRRDGLSLLSTFAQTQVRIPSSWCDKCSSPVSHVAGSQVAIAIAIGVGRPARSSCPCRVRGPGCERLLLLLLLLLSLTSTRHANLAIRQQRTAIAHTVVMVVVVVVGSVASGSVPLLRWGRRL